MMSNGFTVAHDMYVIKRQEVTYIPVVYMYATVSSVMHNPRKHAQHRIEDIIRCVMITLHCLIVFDFLRL